MSVHAVVSKFFSVKRSLLLPSGGLLVMSCAFASAPPERLVCTDVPRAQWMSEQQAREVFQAGRYMLVRFKVSKGNCHEFYAVEPGGAVVEAYLHPVTGAVVKSTRIPAPSPLPAK